MASWFRTPRNAELSILYYLETELSNDWSGVTLVKSFKNASKASLPVVCVELLDDNPIWREIGSHELIDVFGISIDIFATSNGQRLDLASYVRDKIKDGCVFYTHSQQSGSPQTLVRTDAGRIQVASFLEDRKVEIFDNVEGHDRFRHVISIQVRVTQ